MTTPPRQRLSTTELFIGIIFVAVVLMACGLVIHGFREALVIIDMSDPVKQFILTAGANVMFALGVVLSFVLTAVVIWKRLLRR